MKNIKFHIALLCLIFTIQMMAQSPTVRKFSKTSYILQNAQVMPTNAVADDFGPRNLGQTYWHGGIDFNSAQNDGHADVWDLIISPQAGIIADFDRLTLGADEYKYGLVNINDDEGNGSHTLLFGHVFDWHKQFYDEFGSRIVLKRCEDNNFLKWGLHLNFTDAQGNPVRHTYGQISGATLMVNGTNYTTTNLVNTTDIFIPLGKSGGNPSFRFVPHLHLNTLPFNTNSPGSLPTSPNGDPAQFLNIDRPDYRITAISEGSNEAVGVLMKYPGTNPTKIKARTYMIGEADNTYRYSHLMDMDKVELQIKKSYISDWERIKGDKIEAIISEGGRLGEPMVNHSNPVNKSDWRKTGINSNAYNGATEGPNARNPWDDYYFTDYYSRIHKNDMTGNSDPTLYSDIPSNTRYNDGLYDFRVKTTTSSNGITYSNAQPIYIDNFLPFITDFKFKIGSDPGTSTVFYEIERKQDEGVVDKNDDGYVSNAEHYYKIGLPSPTSKYFIEINTSEPVQQLRYKIKKKDQEFPSNSTIMTQVGNSKMIWRADLSQTLFITQQDELELEITGNDQANNQLVNVADMTRIIAEFNLPEFQIKIPTRKTNQRTKLAWNNYPSKIGKDRFKVKMSGCQRSASEEICDLIKTVEEEKSLYNCTQVRIDLKNYDNRIELKWYDENGDEILAFANDPTIEVSEPERFCFKLYGEFGDDCCTREGCVFVEASDFEDNSIIITPTIYPGCSNLGPQNGRITLAVDPIGQNYNYSWSHHPNWNFVWAELPTGNHSVTVTTTNGCKKSLLFSIEDIADVVNVYEDNIPSECGQNNGEINLNVTLDEQESSQFFYQWSHGLSGFDYSSVYNLSPGQNCVTISIDGSLNNCSVQRCFEVTERNFDVTATVSPNSNCNLNTPNGSINLSTTGGVEPFTAIWGDNITGMSRENLRTGFYGVTVTDANGCSASNVFVVPGTENITFTGEISMDCITKLYKIRLNNFSLQQNFIMFLYKIENGVKTFKQIFAGYNGAALENLSDGDYEISTTNFSCATGSLQFNIPKPLQITNQQTQENVGCTPDEVNGSITVDFEGGLRPLTVGIGIQSQTVMENSVTFNNINGGLYFLTFEDPNGCLIWTLTGLQYPVMEINGAITHPTGQNSSPPPSNGSILLNVYGGSQDFEYTWTKNNNFYSNEKDLIGLSSGYYKVVVFDPLTGCSNEKRFTLISDICGRELTIGQTLMNCSPGSSGNYSNCSTGCPKDIKILIGSVLNDVANYKLPITVTLSNGLFTGTYTITELTNERGYAFFYNVPVSMTPYYVHAVDECNNSASSELYTCASCSPIMKIYDIISIRDNPGKFDLELYKACEFETGVFKYKSKIRIKNDALAACQDYTITWPDGNETSRVYRNCSSNSTRVKNKWYHLRESDFDGGIKTITIRRNDGCSRTVDFRLGDKKDVVGIRHKNLPSFGRLGVANLPCKDCNTDVIPPVRNLYKESFFCKENSLNDFKKLLKKFHYIPNNNGEPCIGGKLIRHKAFPTGIVENHEEIVSPNAFLSTAAWVARDDDEKEYAYFSFGMIDQDNGGCIFSKEYMFPESYLVENMYVNWFRLVKWNLYNSPKTLECGQILKITKIGKIIEIIIDPGSWSHNFIITDENNTILQSHPVSSQGVLIRYHFNTETYEGQMFKFELKNSGNCPNSVKTLDDSFCPVNFNILPEDFNQETEDITFNCYSPIVQNRWLYIYGPDDLVNPIHNENISLIEGLNSIHIAPNPFIDKPSGDYIFELEGAGGCPTLEMKYTINNLVGEDDSENISCKDVNIDLVYDSTYHNFGLFVGKEEIDSIYSFKISFDTLHGSVKEFTHHEIHWDWVKHVRYDSTKTVYYFGTDSIIRSFITTIDASGHSFTQWYNDIVFVSCGPLNKQGIWTLIGYKVSEQKYYMYVFDKINLTPLPLLIPNENRGQTYTKVWNFGPDEYATKIVSGQYEIVRFASNAYPPFEISLSRPFKIKTISKWNSNQWMVGGDLNGSIVIAGDTIVSEDWTKTIFIWYDWTGTIIKYKVIESEEDRILTHVATDAIEKIVFAGFEIDSSYFNNFDSLSVDSCIFGDTISIEGIPQLKQGVFGNFEPEIIFDNPKYAMNDDYVKFYPNPFKAGINLQYESVRDQNIKVILINALGQIVFESDLSVSIGPNELYLKEFEYLPGGLYNAIVKNNATEKVYKLIKIE